MRNFKIFSDPSVKDSSIERMSRRMEERIFTRGQTVYLEGQSEVDGVYFITQGDFEVTQKIKIDDNKSKQFTLKAKGVAD